MEEFIRIMRKQLRIFILTKYVFQLRKFLSIWFQCIRCKANKNIDAQVLTFRMSDYSEYRTQEEVDVTLVRLA